MRYRQKLIFSKVISKKRHFPRNVDSRNDDSRNVDSRKVDSRNDDSRNVDSRNVDSRNVDSRNVDSLGDKGKNRQHNPLFLVLLTV